MSEILWYIGGVVFVAIGIGFSIGWHELGHLLPAKLFGIKVPRYMIGFGPTLWSRKRGETEYGIKAIPLGGYITMIGMYAPAKPGAKPRKGFGAEAIEGAREAHNEHVGPGDENRKFYQLPIYKRIIIMFGGPFMNLILGVALTFAAFGGIGTYVSSTKIVEVADCVPSDFVNQVSCADTDAIAPAKLSGLMPNDTVLKVNGNEVRNWNEITEYAEANAGELVFTVQRGNEQLDLDITPAMVERPVSTSSGTTEMQIKPYFGVVLDSVRQSQDVQDTFAYSASAVGSTFELMATLPVQVVTLVGNTISGEERDLNGPISVIGIGQVAGEIASDSDADWLDKLGSGLMMLASLNFALFAFNMIPLLPLDGGHIAGAIYESIKKGIWRLLRKPNPGPADTALMMPITYVVTIALIAMSLILILVDVINPVSLG
ncbi:MAG: site-2 protease family protein [Rhodoluna sp.]|nr:site-2 protease family protein [Rhodoluna sp.]MBP6186572.1 site-2 protease family protein [Rhodoluna sp.]